MTLNFYRTNDPRILVLVDEQAERVVDVATISDPARHVVDVIRLSVTDAGTYITRLGKGKKRIVTAWLDRAMLLKIALEVSASSDCALKAIRRLDNLIDGPRGKIDDALKEVLGVLLGQAAPSRLITEQMSEWFEYRDSASARHVTMAN